MFTDVLILAGGSGERLWPVSTRDHPKQFMSLEDGISFFQSALLRALALNVEGNILVVSRSDLIKSLLDDCHSLCAHLSANDISKLKASLLIIAEPCAKNTAPAIALACTWINTQKRSVSQSLLVMASDHIITPLENFISDVTVAAQLAQKDAFVSFAVPPTEAATGYGYIQLGDPINISEETGAFKVVSFKEKPDAQTALHYLKSGLYYWNSGMYGFQTAFFMRELARYVPDIAHAFEVASSCSCDMNPHIRIQNEFCILDSWDFMNKAYAVSPSISVDYAIAEKTEHSITLKITFNWDDVGSWDSLSHLFHTHQARVIEVESNNCFVHSDMPVTLCGVEDIIVAVKNGQILVIQKGQSNLVKLALHKEK